MHPEHEEAMRREFAQDVELARQMRSAETEADIDRLTAAREEIEQRWQDGPHAQQWQFLGDAWDDWRQRPDTMRRMGQDIAHNGCGGGFDEVQLRSLDQARTLAEADRPRYRSQQRSR